MSDPSLAGLAETIQEGIELQSLQYVFFALSLILVADYIHRAVLVAEISSGKARELSDRALQDLFDRLRDRLEHWQSLSQTYLSLLVDVVPSLLADAEKEEASIVNESTNEEPVEPTPTKGKRKRTRQPKRHNPTLSEVNSVVLVLPSSLSTEVQQHPTMSAAISLEKEHRKAHCGALLDALRGELIHRYSQKRWQKEASGQRAMTRAHSSLAKLDHAIRKTVAGYRRSREALVSLGVNVNAEKLFELQDEDVKPYIFRFNRQELGDSYKTSSWVWRNLSFLKERSQEDKQSVRDFYIESRY